MSVIVSTGAGDCGWPCLLWWQWPTECQLADTRRFLGLVRRPSS